MLGACNTCVRLQSRVTSSGATVNSWMNFIHLFIYFICFLFLCIHLLIYFFFPFSPLLVCFACFCFVAVDFEFICYSPNILVCTFIIIIVLTCSFHFVVGVLIFCWSENKIFYLGVVYKFLSVGMELAVIKELFIILYI